MAEDRLVEIKNLKDLLILVEDVTIGKSDVVDRLPVDDSSYSNLEKSIFQMLRSITEREKLLEEQSSNLVKVVNLRTKELEQQKMINVHNSKMSALGEMAGGIAHEINTPLATMKMLVGSANRELDKPQHDLNFIFDKLKKINITIDRIAKIVKGLKAFSRDGAKDPFLDVSIKSIVDDTLFLCKENFNNRSVDLRVLCNVELPLCECRSIQISQVVLNLLNNSLDAVENLEEKWVEVRITEDEKSIYIFVTDSGLGIPKESQSKIFDPFFTTKGVEKGTGIGLSISLGIIKEHLGDLYLNDENPNTQFMVRLPKKLP